MSDERTQCCGGWRTGIYVIVALGTFLIVGGLVKLMVRYTQAPSPAAARAQERAKNLAEYRQVVAGELGNYAKQDAAKGVVRLPIERAMELTAQEWQNPAAGRSNLLARFNKANPPPPPPPKFD